jgi:SAM-dependent methyltransferase
MITSKETGFENHLMDQATPSAPSFAKPVCQIATALQYVEPEFKRWACRELGWQFGFNRKLWEYAFILNALHVYGKLGGRGLGFGIGREPTVSVMLRHGSTVVVSDLSDEDAQARGWATMELDLPTGSSLSYRFVDMNDVPSDLVDFDFVWSCGSLEHIGGLENGLRFIENAMGCLKPGGIAVHTTEFTLTSNEGTFESPGLSFYRQKDIEALAERLKAQGHELTVNLARGNHLLDQLVCDPEPPWELTLNAPLMGHVITSVGIIIGKRG